MLEDNYNRGKLGQSYHDNVKTQKKYITVVLNYCSK